MVSARQLETLNEAERQGWLMPSKASALRAENEKMRASLKAQEEADEALESRFISYDEWHALDNKAAEMRRKILGLM